MEGGWECVANYRKGGSGGFMESVVQFMHEEGIKMDSMVQEMGGRRHSRDRVIWEIIGHKKKEVEEIKRGCSRTGKWWVSEVTEVVEGGRRMKWDMIVGSGGCTRLNAWRKRVCSIVMGYGRRAEGEEESEEEEVERDTYRMGNTGWLAVDMERIGETWLRSKKCGEELRRLGSRKSERVDIWEEVIERVMNERGEKRVEVWEMCRGRGIKHADIETPNKYVREWKEIVERGGWDDGDIWARVRERGTDERVEGEVRRVELWTGGDGMLMEEAGERWEAKTLHRRKQREGEERA